MYLRRVGRQLESAGLTIQAGWSVRQAFLARPGVLFIELRGEVSCLPGALDANGFVFGWSGGESPAGKLKLFESSCLLSGMDLRGNLEDY